MRMGKFQKILFSLIIMCSPFILCAGHGGAGAHAHKMPNLVLQLAVIIIMAKLFGILFDKMKLPAVLGELFAGIVIGPYLLGKIPLPGFPEGLFPLAEGGGLPITVELYGFAIIASILLLFMAGLETDLKLLKRFAFSGSVIGIGGVVVSFFIGAYTGVLFLPYFFPESFSSPLSILDPSCLFIGVLSTATSVGITARILSERRQMDSPEGVSILAAAVIDDVLGIILLAIVLGIAKASKVHPGEISIAWSHIGGIALKAISVWLGVTCMGLLFAHKLSSILKKFTKPLAFSLMALAFALLLSSMFEKAGLAMIIGAYVMGIILSKTDLSYVIQEALHPLHEFFVPVFFTISGMLINLNEFSSKEVFFFGLIYSAGAIIAKLIGCGLPARLLKFNQLGSMRIGLGMATRGEVALIIASIGLSNHILNNQVFGAVVMMPLVSAMLVPPLLNKLFMSQKKGIEKSATDSDIVVSDFEFPSSEAMDFIIGKIVAYFRNEGFFINMIQLKNRVFHIRKEEVFLSMTCYPKKVLFNSSAGDVVFVKTLMYEALLDLQNNVSKLQQMAKPEELKKELLQEKTQKKVSLDNVISPGCIISELKGTNKNEVIEELVDLLNQKQKIKDKEKVFQAVLDREEQMSTGMQDGLALPHCRIEAAEKPVVAIGIHRQGIDFESFDGLPAQIIVLLVSPVKASSHIEVLAGIGGILGTKEAIEKLLTYDDNYAIWKFFTQNGQE